VKKGTEKSYSHQNVCVNQLVHVHSGVTNYELSVNLFLVQQKQTKKIVASMGQRKTCSP